MFKYVSNNVIEDSNGNLYRMISVVGRKVKKSPILMN